MEAVLFVVKDRDPQITPIPQIFDFSRRNRRALLRAGSSSLSMTFVSKQHKAIEAEASACTTLRENGTGCRAKALPKVRNLFEDAHWFRKVSILENLDDSFEDAHPFPRCAPKSAHLRRGTKIVCQTGLRAPPARRCLLAPLSATAPARS